VKRIAVLASGGGTNFQAVIDGCKNGEIDGQIVCLIYNRKNAGAKERARVNGIPSVYINRLKYEKYEDMQQEVFKTLLKYDAEIVVLAGYLEKLSAEATAHFTNKIINTHPALMPSFCGAGFYGERVHQAVLDYGAKVSGCTIHFVDEKYDHGPIIFQQAVPVMPDDDAHTLQARILPVEHGLIRKTVGLLCADKIKVENRKVIIEE